MTSAALQAFNSQRLASQTALFGQPVKVNDTQGTGCYSAPRFQRELAEGGFKVGHDATLRLTKSAWPALTTVALVEAAKIELQLNNAWVRFKVAEVTDVTTGGEWRIGLEALV